MTSMQILIALYTTAMGAFIISENRNPQSSFAWMFLFIALPVIGPVIYFLFGRDYKAFSRRRRLTRQNAPRQIKAVPAALEVEHDTVMAALKARPARLDLTAGLILSNANTLATLYNRVEVLENAKQAYPALIAAIRGAKSSIHMHYYSWASDKFGTELGDILAAKAAEGVKVRVLYDPVGSFWMLKRAYVRAMQRAGVDMKPFSALWRVHTISYRNHRKNTVIDGKVGFTGGLNIGDEHITPPAGFDLWRDTNIRIEGSAVRCLQGIFVTDWINATGEDIAAPKYFPLMDTGGGLPGQTPVQICLSGPDSEWQAIRQLYFEMITSARAQVLITSPFFILDDTISEALKSAALSGVDVRVMISARGPGQYVPYWAANTFAAEITKAGATVLLYDPGYLHAKTICVDGEVCAIGSANWDIRSFAINYELVAVIYDAMTATRLCETFRRDEARCRPFKVDVYEKTAPLLRFRDSLARLVSPLL